MGIFRKRFPLNHWLEALCSEQPYRKEALRFLWPPGTKRFVLESSRNRSASLKVLFSQREALLLGNPGPGYPF